MKYSLVFDKRSKNNFTKIVLKNGRYIFIKDIFFRVNESDWLSSINFPQNDIINVKRPSLLKNYIFHEYIPLLILPYDFKISDHWFILSKNNVTLKLDIFGTIFFMLSRYEEFVSFKSDNHGRYDSKHSLILKNNLNLYPIVDAYVSILRFFLKNKQPSLRFKKQFFEIKLSSDFDRPYCFTKLSVNIKTYLWFLKYKEIVSSFEFLYYYLIKIIFRRDIYITYLKKQIEIAERFGFSFHIYVMNAVQGIHDFGYNPKSGTIFKIINYALKRGHQIGFHPSYNTCNDHHLYQIEKKGLESKIGFKILSNRQHYLKMNIPYTWQYYEDNNILEDHSLGYHDTVGFRAGTSHKFKLYDLVSRRTLNVYENPLIIMDCGLLKSVFKNSYISVLKKAFILIKICKYYNGNFSFLWHNSSFNYDWRYWRYIFFIIVKYCDRIKKS